MRLSLSQHPSLSFSNGSRDVDDDLCPFIHKTLVTMNHVFKFLSSSYSSIFSPTQRTKSLVIFTSSSGAPSVHFESSKINFWKSLAE